MLINPYGWTENGMERTPFPAQVPSSTLPRRRRRIKRFKLGHWISSSVPCFDGESTLEAHSEEIEENDDLVSSKLEVFVANHECQSECSNDVPPDGLLMLSPSITSVQDGMISPISFDLHREIAE
ncbi:hypothetical protein AAC387_Pa02g2415 [Persea americana]